MDVYGPCPDKSGYCAKDLSRDISFQPFLALTTERLFVHITQVYIGQNDFIAVLSYVARHMTAQKCLCDANHK